MKDSFSYQTSHPDIYPLLKEFARKNRKNQTLAERVLWEQLRAKRQGHNFLRQHIIGDYIADFACLESKLVIEVDGGYHAERQQQEDDAIRTRWLESVGFKVIRFTNEEVLYDTINVINKIKSCIQPTTQPS